MRQVSLKATPLLYFSVSDFQHMPSRRWRSVASSYGGQAECFFGELREMRREDDAAGVAGPVLDIEAGVIFGQEGIAGVAEDGFDEIEIGDESTRGRRSGLPWFCGADAGDFRADERAQQQRDERARGGWAGWR